MPRRYWLLKTEPGSFSFEDLLAAKDRTTAWDGVRNYQARNFLRDEMKVGDGVLIYHSRIEPMAVVGEAEIVRAGYPDPTQFLRDDHHFDAKAKRADPTWFQVDVRAVRAFAHPVTLERIKQTRGLAAMPLVQRGSRLSVQPVAAAEFRLVVKLGSSAGGQGGEP